MNRRRRPARTAQSPSIADLSSKLSRIISRHDQLKIAFRQLHSQIRTGLLEAEDVFASLAVPLMRLVGLKSVEMAEEGRFSAIITTKTNSTSEDCWRSNHGPSRPLDTMTAEAYEDQRTCKMEDEHYAKRATMASTELMQKQKLQLVQLVHILRQIESQVNSSQDVILQTLSARHADIRNFFQQAVKYISVIHQSGQDNGICLFTLKLLKAAFDHVGAALCSVEDGVEEMIRNLAEKMCTPMVKYVHGLKIEMTTGTSAHLATIIEEMGGAMRIGRLQLVEARTKAREAEETKREALHRLKNLEERVRKTKHSPGFLLEAKNGLQGRSTRQKLLGTEADEKKDEKLLWELLRSKRKYQLPDSPLGPKGLLGIETDNKRSKSTRVKPSVSHVVITRSKERGLSPRTPCIGSLISLGASPSTTTQQLLSRNRITP